MLRGGRRKRDRSTGTSRSMTMTMTVATMAPMAVAVTHNGRGTGGIIGVPSLQTRQSVHLILPPRMVVLDGGNGRMGIAVVRR